MKKMLLALALTLGISGAASAIEVGEDFIPNYICSSDEPLNQLFDETAIARNYDLLQAAFQMWITTGFCTHMTFPITATVTKVYWKRFDFRGKGVQLIQFSMEGSETLHYMFWAGQDIQE